MPEDEVASSFGRLGADDVPDTVDEAAVERMRTVAKLLDELVTVPGTNFKVGLDPVVGSVPVVGDALSAGISLYIVAESARLGVSYDTLLKMLVNVGVDTAGGSIPIVGTLFDAVWKSNTWNIAMALADLSERPLDEDRAVTIEVQ